MRAELDLPTINYGRELNVRALAKAHGFDPGFELAADNPEGENHHFDNDIRVLFLQKPLETRLKAIEQRAKSHLAETGLQTLFLALGFLEYPDDKAKSGKALAPLMLLPVELRRKKKGHQFQFSLAARKILWRSTLPFGKSCGAIPIISKFQNSAMRNVPAAT